MIDEYRITTIDNPFDPFEQFQEWFMFDVEKGYNSCAYLARICKTSKAYSPAEVIEATNKAIDEIIEHDFMGIYLKVKRSANDE